MIAAPRVVETALNLPMTSPAAAAVSTAAGAVLLAAADTVDTPLGGGLLAIVASVLSSTGIVGWLARGWWANKVAQEREERAANAANVAQLIEFLRQDRDEERAERKLLFEKLLERNTPV